MSETSAEDRWREDQTTFQRIYDVLTGTQSFLTADEFAERAACSETAARNALEQLAEMGIATRREGRPATYRRNESYLRWKRIESLAQEHDPERLRERLDDLMEADETFQERYDLPSPDAISTEDLSVEDQDTVEKRWEDASEWRTVRRDIRLLRHAVERAQTRADDGAYA